MQQAHQQSDNQDISPQSFKGMQAEERLLYELDSHPLRNSFDFFKVVLLGVAAYLAWGQLGDRVPVISEDLQQRVAYVIIGASILALCWVYKYHKSLRAYLTDRRIVKFEAVFPITEKQSSLMWKDAATARGVASNFLWRLIKIGDLEVIPKITDGRDEMSFRYIYYFEDLASYINKITYITQHEPEKISEVRPFVPAPKGKRY